MKKWLPLMALVTAILLGVFALGRTAIPNQWDAAELTVSERMNPSAGLELTLEVKSTTIEVIMTNSSDLVLESGAGVDGYRNLMMVPGLDVLLNGTWYVVPNEEYSSAGVGLTLEPGDAVRAKVSLTPYGDLPDGQYRIWLSTTHLASGTAYVAYADLVVEDGRCIAQEIVLD